MRPTGLKGRFFVSSIESVQVNRLTRVSFAYMQVPRREIKPWKGGRIYIFPGSHHEELQEVYRKVRILLIKYRDLEI